ncbi:MAG: VOC family protein [Nitrosomonadales bacterium]|nr:VOC family protein [Nitrosomonadales bacterium]
MTNNPVNWFEIYVQDMARAKRFYESVLQTKLEKLDSGDLEMWGFPMDMGRFGASGSLVRIEGAPSGGNSTLVYFSCADCAVGEERIRAAGGQIHKTKFPIGKYGFIVLATDTEGNMFGLHSMQ